MQLKYSRLLPVFYLDISWGNSPPKCRVFPQRPIRFPAVKTNDFDFPTVNLVSFSDCKPIPSQF